LTALAVWLERAPVWWDLGIKASGRFALVFYTIVLFGPTSVGGFLLPYQGCKWNRVRSCGVTSFKLQADHIAAGSLLSMAGLSMAKSGPYEISPPTSTYRQQLMFSREQADFGSERGVRQHNQSIGGRPIA
jgi:hypothetical protein